MLPFKVILPSFEFDNFFSTIIYSSPTLFCPKYFSIVYLCSLFFDGIYSFSAFFYFYSNLCCYSRGNSSEILYSAKSAYLDSLIWPSCNFCSFYKLPNSTYYWSDTTILLPSFSSSFDYPIIFTSFNFYSWENDAKLSWHATSLRGSIHEC